MAVIQAARRGDAAAQLALGKQYLSGGVGLPKNLATALYWLERAAEQSDEVGALIARCIPFEVALQAPQPLRVRQWYEQAYDTGDVQAGLVFAKLVFSGRASAPAPGTRSKAIAALEAAARTGDVDAQLLLMQQLGATSYLPVDASGSAVPAETGDDKSSGLGWAVRAAENGALQAQRALAVHAWSTGDMRAFVRWAVPVTRAIAADLCQNAPAALREEDILLLSRCAKALHASGAFQPEELERFWTLAAQGGDRDAQLALGLWLARADASGNWAENAPKYSDYKQAIHWLTAAGEQGATTAWVALARILRRPHAGQYGRKDVQPYLERAAEAGDGPAQLELGLHAWRARAEDEENDVRAAYWLQKASAQGSADAHRLLKKIASLPVPSPWAVSAQRQLGGDAAKNHPFLAARIELATLFGLSFPEAILLDVNTADRRHCLLVDIRKEYGRAARRLVLIQTIDERRALSRIARLFANIDCNSGGPEGAYQKRLYLFRKLVSLSDEEADAMFRPQIRRLATAYPDGR